MSGVFGVLRTKKETKTDSRSGRLRYSYFIWIPFQELIGLSVAEANHLKFLVDATPIYWYRY